MIQHFQRELHTLRRRANPFISWVNSNWSPKDVLVQIVVHTNGGCDTLLFYPNTPAGAKWFDDHFKLESCSLVTAVVTGARLT